MRVRDFFAMQMGQPDASCQPVLHHISQATRRNRIKGFIRVTCGKDQETTCGRRMKMMEDATVSYVCSRHHTGVGH